MRILAPHVSAVLLDPEYSAAQSIANRALPSRTGLVVAIEETGYGGSLTAPCPGTVLSAGVNFDLFTRQVEIACRNGELGYISGRTLWKKGLSLPLPERGVW